MDLSAIIGRKQDLVMDKSAFEPLKIQRIQTGSTSGRAKRKINADSLFLSELPNNFVEQHINKISYGSNPNTTHLTSDIRRMDVFNFRPNMETHVRTIPSIETNTKKVGNYSSGIDVINNDNFQQIRVDQNLDGPTSRQTGYVNSNIVPIISSNYTNDKNTFQHFSNKSFNTQVDNSNVDNLSNYLMDRNQFSLNSDKNMISRNNFKQLEILGQISNKHQQQNITAPKQYNYINQNPENSETNLYIGDRQNFSINSNKNLIFEKSNFKDSQIGNIINNKQNHQYNNNKTGILKYKIEGQVKDQKLRNPEIQQVLRQVNLFSNHESNTPLINSGIRKITPGTITARGNIPKFIS